MHGAESEMVERVQVGVTYQHDVAAITAVAAGRTALRLVLLPPEGDAAPPATSTVDVKPTCIDEMHGLAAGARRGRQEGSTLTKVLS